MEIKILLIEDSPVDACLIAEMLKKAESIQTDLRCEDNLKDGIHRLKTETYDIVLLDLNLPDSHGLETMTRIRGYSKNAPIIIMTGMDDKEMGVKAVNRGAHDYIVKGRLGTESLERVILYAIERKRSESALYANLTFMETLINTIPNPVFYKDKAGRYLGCNETFAEKIYGLPKDEIIGRTLFEFRDRIPENVAALYHQQDLELIQKEGALFYESRIHCADGKLRDFYFNKAVFYDPSNSPMGIVGIMQDISDHKEDEKRLEFTNQVLKLLNRSTDMKDVIHEILILIREAFDIDAVGIRLKSGDDYPYYKTNGFSKDFVEEENFICTRDSNGNCIRDDNGNAVSECICGAVILGKPVVTGPALTLYGSFWTNSMTDFHETIKLKQKDKTSIRDRCCEAGYESLAIIPLLVENETIGLLQLNCGEKDLFTLDLVEYFEGIAASIGIAIQRMKSEETLVQSESRYKQLFEHMSSGVAVYEPVNNGADFILKEHNPAGERITGLKKEDVIGKSVLEVFPGVQEVGFFNAFQRAWKTGNPIRQPASHYQDNRISLWIENFVFNLPSGEIVAVYDDITSRKQEEEQRKLLEEQLQQAQKMESIGTLASGIAHDFNNILSSIIGYAELAKYRVPEDDEMYGDLNEILEAGNRAKQLVSQILTFSRQSADELKPVRIDIIVKEAIKMLRSTIPATIQIIGEIHASAQVMADPTKIHQIVMNLCTNAYHAMQNEGGVLTVGLREVYYKEGGQPKPDMPPGRYIKLTIQDTGIGMSVPVMERIFDPYFTTKEKGAGTGLGLAVVHGIVKAHHASIVVQSQPGNGSAFDLYFPAIKQELNETLDKRKFDTPLPTGSETLLFVDDEAPITRVWKQSLESLGYTVDACTSSTEALDMFKKAPEKYAAVITDVTMPEMTGIALATAILSIRHDIPIIVCTGFSEIMSEETATAIGIRALLMKPVLKKDLAETVRQVLDEKAGSRTSWNANGCMDG